MAGLFVLKNEITRLKPETFFETAKVSMVEVLYRSSERQAVLFTISFRMEVSSIRLFTVFRLVVLI